MHAAILVILLGATPVVSSAPTRGNDAIVVCPKVYRQALKPWLDYRRSQGHRCHVISNLGTADQLRKRIHRAAKNKKIGFLVLVGDHEPGAERDKALRARSVPAMRMRAKVNLRFGGKPDIATDNEYADLDGDHLPDLAVGRLSVDSSAELTRLVEKILAYERSAEYGIWRRRLNFVIGVGRFGPLIDAALDSGTRHLLTGSIPDSYLVSITRANWQSPYCPDPRRFRETTLARLDEGSLFWIYIGHGKSERLDTMRVPRKRYPILHVNDVPRLSATTPPIALFLACSTGEYDNKRDSLAERMVREPGGPVAAIAGSRVTMPYSMAIFGAEMMESLFETKSATLGEMVVRAKRNMVAKKPNDPDRQMINTVARLVSPTRNVLDEERKEHLFLFNLLGDPMLRLVHPAEIPLEVASPATAGQRLTVKGTLPSAGRVTLELALKRGRLKFLPPHRPEYPRSEDELAQFQDVYNLANDDCLFQTRHELPAGPFELELDVPATAEGTCVVRAHLEGRNGQKSFALGSAPLQVAPATGS